MFKYKNNKITYTTSEFIFKMYIKNKRETSKKGNANKKADKAKETQKKHDHL